MTENTKYWSSCPHDCPGACALEVELLHGQTVGRVRGSAEHSYTYGVVCGKMSRYSERIHHPDRLLFPMRRTGTKGEGIFERITWDAALDEVAERFLAAEAKYGAETVWPYYYSGTMGKVQRDSINRLRHVKRYSGQKLTRASWAGYTAGCGAVRGSDSREMSKSDLIVVWGANPVHTQINIMSHITRARKERGARLVVVDVYETPTMRQADIALLIRPGTDAALACAVMHCLFRDGYADRAYLEKYTDQPQQLEAHLRTRTPEWAAAITGLSSAEIEAFARTIGETNRTFFRLGYGFTRTRNGSVNMHAVLCVPTVRGNWQYEGGGALHSCYGLYQLNKSMIEGLDALNPTTRMLDQSRIGAILTDNVQDLANGPPVTAMLIQNTNPANIAPDQTKVLAGLAREDLFLCVHEQFLTETAKYADILLPTTMFLEHDDMYTASGHPHIMFGPKIVDAPGECRSNHWMINELAKRLGVEHPGFDKTERELIDWTLKASGRGDLDKLLHDRWIECAPSFETAHFLDGFAHEDRKFHFKAEWATLANGALTENMPTFPDHWSITDETDDTHPFRLVTAPARAFLGSIFTETPTARENEVRPRLYIHPKDAAEHGIADHARICIGNERGRVEMHARYLQGMRRGVVIAEGVWPNHAHRNGCGINVLISADAIPPAGGAPFHDTHVWVRLA